MVDFAKPLSALSKPILGDLSPTSDPTGGRGFTLDETAKVPLVVEGGVQQSMEIVEVSVNLGSTAAHSGAVTAVTIPNLVVGDFCFYLGQEAGSAFRSFLQTTEPLCVVENEIQLNYFNADSSGPLNPNAATYYFLVIHRFK